MLRTFCKLSFITFRIVLEVVVFLLQVVSLIVSDVIGDSLGYIASGPTVVDPDLPPAVQACQSIQILQRYSLLEKIPISLRRFLTTQSTHSIHPTQILDHRVNNYIIGNNQVALNAAMHFLSHRHSNSTPGEVVIHVFPTIVTHELAGDSAETGRAFAELIWYTSLHLFWLQSQNPTVEGQQSPFPDSIERCLKKFSSNTDVGLSVFSCCEEAAKYANYGRSAVGLLFGGETTVIVDEKRVGRSAVGGRCSHFALAAAARWYELTRNTEMFQFSNLNAEIAALFGATDGLDGPKAGGGGAAVDLIPNTVINSNEAYLDAIHHLHIYDSYGFLKKYSSGNIIPSKLTDTNVMDLMIAVITMVPAIDV